MDEMEKMLTKLCDLVTTRANVPDLNTMETLEQYLLSNEHQRQPREHCATGKKMKSMVEAQQVWLWGTRRQRLKAGIKGLCKGIAVRTGWCPRALVRGMGRTSACGTCDAWGPPGKELAVVG